LKDPQAVPALIDALKIGESDVRQLAALALKELGVS
jgi:HEAT repeat protein